VFKRNKLILAALLAAGSATVVATTASFASGAARHPDQAKASVANSVRISARNVPGLGMVLVNSAGRTLYVFAPDKGKRVTCGPKLGCALVWPPVFISATGKAVAGSGVKQSLLSSDPDRYAPGKHVVTYKGWPLYLYKGDHKSGTATGQDTKGSGGYWYVITTTGQVIKHKPTKGGGTGTTPTTSTTTSTPSTTTTTPNTCPAGTTDQDGDGDQNAGGVDDADGCL